MWREIEMNVIAGLLRINNEENCSVFIQPTFLGAKEERTLNCNQNLSHKHLRFTDKSDCVTAPTKKNTPKMYLIAMTSII